MIKVVLQQVNKTLSRYNSAETPSLWMFWHKWNYEHTFTKNLLQFSNRVLKEINRYHVFKWDWMIGIAGAAAGFIVIQLQQIYYQVKIGYKPSSSNVIIHGVLRNQAVSNKLKQTLNINVFQSPDLQFYIHQALLNQVLHPQKQTIKKLILAGLHSLRQKQNFNYLSNFAEQNISILEPHIKYGALTFLNSQTMDKITANGIKSVLESLFMKQLIASQINQAIKSTLKEQKNSEYLYQIIKEKISF